ncbi:MAG: hypothetical protein ABI601_12825 [bacterium]
MRIKPEASIQTRPEAAVPARPIEPAKARVGSAPNTAKVGASRTDSVEISSAGRAFAARSDGVSAERAARIRQNVLGGAYDSVAVVDEVARRILGSGDIA